MLGIVTFLIRQCISRSWDGVHLCFLTLFFTYDKNLLTISSTSCHTNHVQPRQSNNLPHPLPLHSTSHSDRLFPRFTRLLSYHPYHPRLHPNPFLSPYQIILKLSLSTPQSTSRSSPPVNPSSHHLLLRPTAPLSRHASRVQPSCPRRRMDTDPSH